MKMNYVCRTCLLSDNDEMESIYSMKCINEENISISEMIALCVGLEISKHDNFTDVICNSCAYILIAAFNYRSTCWESQKKLLQQFDQQKKLVQQKTTNVFEYLNCPKNLVEEKKTVDVVEIINCAKKEIIIIEDDENCIENDINYKSIASYEAPTISKTLNDRSKLTLDSNDHQKANDVFDYTNCMKNLVVEEKTAKQYVIIVEDEENFIENVVIEKPIVSYETDVTPPLSQTLSVHSEITLDNNNYQQKKTIDVVDYTNCAKNLVEEEKATDVEIINCRKEDVIIIEDDENYIENAGSEKPFACYDSVVIPPVSQTLSDHAELTLDNTISGRGKRYNFRTCEHFVVIPNGFMCSLCVKINVPPSIDKKQKSAVNNSYICGETLFKCKYCAYRSTKNCKLILHQRRSHKGERTLSCRFCGKGFLTTVKRLEHMAIHLKPQYKCSVCQKKIASRILYKEHMAIHKLSEPSIRREINTDEKNHICKLCGKGFLRQLSWQNHMKSYHN